MKPRRLVASGAGCGVSGDELLARLRSAAAARGLTFTAASVAIFGHVGASAALKGKASVTSATRDKVEAWLIPSFARLAAVRPGMRAGDFVELLEREAARAQFTAAALSKRIFETHTRLPTLRNIPEGRIRRETAARVHAFLASLAWHAQIDGIDELAAACAEPEPPAALEHAAPAAPVREPKLPPAGKRRTARSWQSTAARHRSDAETAQAERDRRRQLGELAVATRAPGETIADRLRRLGSECDAADDEDVGELGADRRARGASGLSSPSDLIRKAQAEWPDQVTAVAAIAVEEGFSRGEAWRRVIAAGIECLREGGSA